LLGSLARLQGRHAGFETEQPEVGRALERRCLDRAAGHLQARDFGRGGACR
jgi:hypothetical protein